MIRPHRPADRVQVARHYDELDRFYRALWGEHLHHGLWTTGSESPEEAAVALVDEVARRAGIGPGSRVCDVGSGYGAVARRLAALGSRVTGLTISEAQYRHAVSKGERFGAPGHGGDQVIPRPSPRFLLRDWMENGLDDAAFDAVVAIESLSHIRDPARALGEAYRVLRPGGRLVACVWLAAERPRAWERWHLLRPICDEGRLSVLPAASDYGRWIALAGFRRPELDDVSHRVARTWSVCARRLAGALPRPASLCYLLDGRNSERAFALSVLRLFIAFRTGAMRYGIVTATRPV